MLRTYPLRWCPGQDESVMSLLRHYPASLNTDGLCRVILRSCHLMLPLRASQRPPQVLMRSSSICARLVVATTTGHSSRHPRPLGLHCAASNTSTGLRYPFHARLPLGARQTWPYMPQEEQQPKNVQGLRHIFDAAGHVTVSQTSLTPLGKLSDMDSTLIYKVP